MSIDAGMQKDFDALAEFTGTAAIFYSDIHNEKVQTNTHYDYMKVISTVSKVRGWSEEKTITELEEKGVLKYQSDGDFVVNVGSGRNPGGGGNVDYGLVLFTYDDSRPEHIYHEYAHSLQHIYEVFDDTTIADMYQKSGVDMDKEPEEAKDYRLYINEMHAEAFAYSAMLLRAKDTAEFVEIATKGLNYGTRNTKLGSKEKRTDYRQNPKYYATYPIMKETINTIWKMRKQGKAQEFFDDDGVIKYKELSELAKKITKEKAYQPIQFKAFKYNDDLLSMIDKNNNPQNSDYITDVIDSSLLQIPFTVINKINKNKRQEYFSVSKDKHRKLIEQNIENQKSIFESYVYPNAPKAEVALRSIEKIHAGISMIDQKLNMGNWVNDCLRVVVAKRYKVYSSPYDTERDCACILEMADVERNETNMNMMKDFFDKTDKILYENKDNEYFKKIMSYSDLPFYQQRNAMDTLRYNPEKLEYYDNKQPIVTPLMYLEDSDSKNLYEIKIWERMGFNLNARDKEGKTVLMTAKNFEVAYTLFSMGADLNQVDNDGKNALLNFASSSEIKMEDKKDMIALMIRNGADVNATDINGNNALVHLIRTPSNQEEMKKEIIKELISAGADIKVALSKLEDKDKQALLSIVSNPNAQNLARVKAKLNNSATVASDNQDKENQIQVIISPEAQKILDSISATR